MNYRLANSLIRCELDTNGNLIGLLNLRTGHDYAGGQGLWRIMYSHDEVIEEEILAENCTPHIAHISDDQLQVTYDSMNTPCGLEDFKLVFTIKLQGDELHFSADLENASNYDRVIREFNFPAITNINLTCSQALYGGSASGNQCHVKIDNVAEAIQKCHTQYMADDNGGINMPWFDNGFAIFADAVNGLYLGDHDLTFE